MVDPKYVLPPFKIEPDIRNDPVDVDLIVRCWGWVSVVPGVILPVIVNEEPVVINIAFAYVPEDVIFAIIVADDEPDTIIVGKNEALLTAPITPPAFAVKVIPLFK